MKKIIVLLAFSFISVAIFSQVGGVSNGKLVTLNAGTVSENKLEFEPSFGFATSSNFFDANGDVQEMYKSSDSLMKFSSMGFRMTYGLIENLEVGLYLPVDVSEINFGAKYRLPIDGKLGLGLVAGYNSVLGNQVYDKKSTVYELTPAILGGVIMSYGFSEKLSIDFDAQYRKHTQTILGGHTDAFRVSTDLGYYILNRINLIAGLTYNQALFEDSISNSYLLTLNTGFTVERGENFILIINAPFDLMGKNEFRTKGFGLALTITLD